MHQDINTSVAMSSVLADRAAAQSYRGYLDAVIIDSKPVPKRFWPNADPWQHDLASMITPNLEYVAGLRDQPPGPSRFFWVLPRGSDKTTSIGRAVNWLLAYSRKPIRGAVAAKDADQAGLIVESMKIEAKHNDWLWKRLDFRRDGVGGRTSGSRFTIHASDAAGTWGLNEDIYVLDEITWWENDKLWIPLVSAFAKRRGVVVLIISNAGELDSWQHKVWLEAKSDPTRWQTYSAPEYTCLASWIDESDQNALRKMLPPVMAKRVYDNVWVDPAEAGGYLTQAEAKACEDKSLPQFVVSPTSGYQYVAAVDYGPKRDRTALALGHLDEERGCVIVDRLDVWQGSPTEPIRIQDVEQWMDEVIDLYHADVVCDPYQLEGTVQKWEHTRAVERFEARGGKSNYELAECLRSLVVNRQIRWHPSAGRLILPNGKIETLAQELGRLVTKVTTYGYRMDHTSGRHDDRAVAIGMMCLKLLRDPTRGRWVPPVQTKQPTGIPTSLAVMPSFKLDLKHFKSGLYGGLN